MATRKTTRIVRVPRRGGGASIPVKVTTTVTTKKIRRP